MEEREGKRETREREEKRKEERVGRLTRQADGG
jgi:hypothetical protein